MSTSTATASAETSGLVRGKLNIVGEFHSESDQRRPAEIEFAKAQVGGDYWNEFEFPDLNMELGGRKAHPNPKPGDPKPVDPTESVFADSMQYRSASCAGYLIEKFQMLAANARTASEAPPASVEAAKKKFVDTDLADFMTYRDGLKRRFTSSNTQELDSVVGVTFDVVDDKIKKYKAAIGQNPSAEQWRTAAKALADQGATANIIIPRLAQVAGAELKDPEDIRELLNYLRAGRSNNMGIVGLYTKQIGVWKVGEGHIDDLLGDPKGLFPGRRPVAITKNINLVKREDFNKELEAWMKLHSHA